MRVIRERRSFVEAEVGKDRETALMPEHRAGSPKGAAPESGR